MEYKVKSELKEKKSKKLKTILVIDDAKPILLLLKWLLNRNFNVVTQSSGVDAILWLKNNIPDMIISDVIMPNYNGIDFVTGLKRSGIYRDIPVIMLSGSIEQEKQKEALRAGAYAFINKPFDPDFLKETIDKGLKQAI